MKKLEQEREVIGVDLYGVQQQLAKLQEQLENAHDNHSTITGIREEADNKKNLIQMNATQRAHEREEKKKRCT